MQTIPGVYLEEIFPAPGPELMTGVPAFLGLARKKSADGKEAASLPQRLALWPQFAATFHTPDGGTLYAAVEGFFRNGGSLCYVVPLGEEESFLEERLSKALKELESFDLVDLICVPDIVGGNRTTSQVQQMQGMVLEHCDLMGDRFAILDPPRLAGTDPIADIQQYRQGLHGSNGALYFPWIKIHNGSYIPPCGHIAGAYAQSDREFGVHKAPANDRLEGVLDVQIDLSNAELATLNPGSEFADINCLRGFRGRGIRIWGARTLSREPIWSYINVRRLFLTVGRWIDRNLADVAFEPNNDKLWVRIKRELTAYFESLHQLGALQGNVPQEAFYVKCDGETNPPDARETGKVVTEIGLAPTVPNEFIIVRLIHGTTGVILNPTQSSES